MRPSSLRVASPALELRQHRPARARQHPLRHLPAYPPVSRGPRRPMHAAARGGPARGGLRGGADGPRGRSRTVGAAEAGWPGRARERPEPPSSLPRRPPWRLSGRRPPSRLPWRARRPLRRGLGGRAEVASQSAAGRRCPAGEQRGGGDRLARGGKPSSTRRSNGEVGQHVIAEALYPSGNGVNGRLLNFYKAFFHSRCSSLSSIRVLKERIAAPGAGSLNLVLLALYPVCDAVQRVQRKMEWLLQGGT